MFFLPIAGGRELIGHFGPPYSQPIVGDWEGRGRDSIGICVSGTCFLAVDPQATEGQISASFPGASPDAIGIAGDWNGDRRWNPGMYLPSRGVFLLRDDNTKEPTVLEFPGAQRSWAPVIGDWDGSGRSQLGLYDGSAATFHLLINGHEETRSFGPPRAVPLAGDWSGKGRDDVAAFDRAAGTILLRMGDQGSRTVVVGDRPLDLPLVGHWQDPRL